MPRLKPLAEPIYTATIQYFDEQHGWCFTMPMITFPNKTDEEKKEVQNKLIKLAEIYPTHRFRIHEDVQEYEEV